MRRPTHIFVGTMTRSDDRAPAGWWMTLEEFAKLFTYGQTYGMDGQGPWLRHEIRVADPAFTGHPPAPNEGNAREEGNG